MSATTEHEVDTRDHDPDPTLDQAATTDPVLAVAMAVANLQDRLPAILEACTDPQGLDLAQLLYEVQAARVELQGIERDAEAALGRAMLADQVDQDGWHVERRRSRDRKEWDHDAWRRDVRAKAVQAAGLKGAQGILTAGGELLPADQLWHVLAQVQDAAGSHPPKVGGLRSLGLDPEDYCTSTPGRVQVTVQRRVENMGDESCGS